jgi:putative sugar O-methyltransferase
MNPIKTTESGLWRIINTSYLSPDRIEQIDDFKGTDVNFRIALWNPLTNGVRYLKTLIYNLSADLTPQNRARLTNISNRDVGSPISVTFDGEPVCMDYLQAVYEIEFISSHLGIDGMNILEIGAGYGRTCHAILSNYSVKSYTIVDLKNCLRLSEKYLTRVLDISLRSRVRFVDTNHFSTMDMHHFDLCINIDSFAEMEAEVVVSYLHFIAGHCDNLYVKNPVGKYKDQSLNTVSQPDEVAIAMKMGVLHDILDIHDNSSITDQRQKFLAAYRPRKDWSPVADSWARPWSYYWQALYIRSKENANHCVQIE